jgi:hypothetical protein
MNMDKKDLAKIIGYKSRVSEIFTKKRKLNLKMIRKIHHRMNIPYESLITLLLHGRSIKFSQNLQFVPVANFTHTHLPAPSY